MKKVETPEEKGKKLELGFKDLFSNFLQEIGFSVLSSRKEGGGTQGGKDLIFTFSTDKNGTIETSTFYIEAKNVLDQVDHYQIFGKLAQARNTQIDCWILLAPKVNITPTAQELIDKLDNHLYPFLIQFWTPNEKIEQLISIDEPLYKYIYGLSPKLTTDERSKIIDKWKDNIARICTLSKEHKAKFLSPDDRREWNRRYVTKKVLEENMDSYTPTWNHLHAMEILIKKNSLIICGDPELGKSSIAKSICLEYLVIKGFEPLIITSPDDIEDYYNIEVTQIFFVDDIFGRNSLDQELKKQWERSIQKIKHYIDNNHPIIITSRLAIIKEALIDSTLSSTFIKEYFHIGMDRVSEDERTKMFRQILLNSITNDDMNIRKTLIQNGLTIIRHENFTPGLCHVIIKEFVKGKTSLTPQDINAFLKNPFKSRLEMFEARSEVEKIFLLCILSFKEENIDTQRLKVRFDTVLDRKKIPVLDRFKHILSILENSYIGISNGKVTFFHPVIEDLIQNKIRRDSAYEKLLLEIGGKAAIEVILNKIKGPKMMGVGSLKRIFHDLMLQSCSPPELLHTIKRIVSIFVKIPFDDVFLKETITLMQDIIVTNDFFEYCKNISTRDMKEYQWVNFDDYLHVIEFLTRTVYQKKIIWIEKLLDEIIKEWVSDGFSHYDLVDITEIFVHLFELDKYTNSLRDYIIHTTEFIPVIDSGLKAIFNDVGGDPTQEEEFNESVDLLNKYLKPFGFQTKLHFEKWTDEMLEEHYKEMAESLAEDEYKENYYIKRDEERELKEFSDKIDGP